LSLNLRLDGVAEIARVLPRPVSDDQILALVHAWIGLLAKERYEEAFALHTAREHWTPFLARMVIQNYGSLEPRPDGRQFQVTPVETAVVGPDGPQNPYQAVDWFDEPAADGVVGMVHTDLPLNGTWSDLTVVFELVAGPEGLWLQLDDIHVL
jgi:hypothetical protein